MIVRDVAAAKANLSVLIDSAIDGEEVVIMRNGKPAVRLQPIRSLTLRPVGIDRGLFTIPDDFDDPLPDDVLTAFEGRR